MLELNFANLSSLCDWLDRSRWNAGSPENYDEWLNDFFERGNLIIVQGIEYDYLDCVTLL